MTYDEQIEYLTKNPDQICNEWCYGNGLFKFIGNNINSGCLTQLKSDAPGHVHLGAYIQGFEDTNLKAQIKADERIPSRWEDIKIADLPVFKEWQEKIDKLQNS